MSERAQALEAAKQWQAIVYGDSPETWAALAYYRECGWPVDDNTFPARERVEGRVFAFKAGYRAAGAAPPVGVSPQPDTALKEAATWVLNVVSGVGRAGGEPEPDEGQAAFQALADALSTPDAQVCVWREREWDYESGCRGTQISRDERSSGPPDGWKHCPYCGKRLEVGTAPQGGEQ